MNSLRGVGVALITPFKKDGAVDFPALEKVVDYTITGGVDFLVVLGTTAESATLNKEEKKAVIKCVKEVNGERKPVVVGIGGNNTAQVVADLRESDLTGIEAILSVTPYYNKPSQQGMYAHFKAIAEASPIPVILYNVPGRTGVNLNADTVLRLANEVPNIVAVKEASGNLGQAGYILRGRPEGFSVLSGEDNLTLGLISQGGDGVISVVANVFPKEFCEMVHVALKGDFVAAQAYFKRLQEVTDALFEEGNPAGVKAALTLKGLIDNHLRLPLVPVSERVVQKIKKNIEKYSL